jgi:hypothetical protein
MSAAQLQMDDMLTPEDVIGMADSLHKQHKKAKGLTVSGEKISNVIMILAHSGREWLMVSGSDPVTEIATKMAKHMNENFDPIGLVRYESSQECDQKEGGEIEFSTMALTDEPWAHSVLSEALQVIKSCWQPQ